MALIKISILLPTRIFINLLHIKIIILPFRVWRNHILKAPECQVHKEIGQANNVMGLLKNNKKLISNQAMIKIVKINQELIQDNLHLVLKKLFLNLRDHLKLLLMAVNFIAKRFNAIDFFIIIFTEIESIYI